MYINMACCEKTNLFVSTSMLVCMGVHVHTHNFGVECHGDKVHDTVQHH
jgi:hypothetical protein